MIECRRIRSFLAVQATGSFTAAGRLLFLSQSTISRDVMQLESQLGFQLLIRRGGRARLTTGGRLYVPTARTLLQTVEEAETVARRIRSASHAFSHGRTQTVGLCDANVGHFERDSAAHKADRASCQRVQP